MEEEEKEVLLSKFKLLLGKYKGQQTAITEKDAQNAELRTKMQKLLAHCRTLQEQAGKQPDPTSSVEEGVKEREELAARLKCAENERDEAISKLADATGAAAGAGETDALASRLAASEAQAADEREALSASLAAQRQEYSAVVEERDVWKQKAVATEAQAKRLQEEREVLADTLAKTMEKNVSGEDDIGALQRRLEDNRAEKDAADQRLALVQEEMRAAAEAEYQAAAAQLEKTLEQRLGIAIEESRKECEALSIRMQEEAARSSALEEQIRMFEEKHESSRAVVAGEAEALASKLAAAEAQAAEEREVLSASLAEQKQSYGEVVEELEALKAEAQRAQEERQALADAEKEAADQRLAQVQEEVRAAAEAEYQAAAAQLEKTVEQREGTLEESRKECEALSIRMQEEVARSSALEEQIRMFEEKHESSRAVVAGEAEALASKLAAAEAQAAEEREVLSASLAEQKQSYGEVVEELEALKAEAQRAQEERQALADAEKEAADQRLAQVQEEVRAAAEAEYQAAAAQLEKTVEQREGTLEESRKECEALSIRMQEEAARSSALEEQIRMFEEKHESSRAVVAGEAEALASKLAAAEAQAAEEREVLSASLAEQKQSYGEVVEELEALKAEAQRAQEERQALADAEKEAADQRLAQVQEEVRAAAEAEYQAAAAQLEKTVEQRDGALEESRKECEALSIRMQEEAARSSALKEQTRMFEEKHESSRAAVAGEAEALASKLAAAEAQAAEEREVLSASLAEQKQSYGEVVEELEALKAEAQRAQEERQALADAEKEAADQRLAQVQEEVRAAAEAEYQAAAAQLEKTVEQRDGALEESRKECEALSIRMQEEAARSSALEEQIRMFEEKHEASRAVVAGEAEALASKLAAAEAQVLSAEARQGEHASVHARVVAEKDATASRLQEAGARLAALEAQQEQREARWALERTSTAETIGGLQDQLDTALAERASTSTHAEESVREMEERCAKALVDIRRDMEATIAAAEKERDAMALNLAQAEAQIKSEQDRAEDERETLSTALNEKAQMVAIVKEAEAAAEASRKECDTLTFRLQEETRVGSEKESNAVLEKETTASKLEEAEARCAERMEALATLTDEHAVISAKLSATEEDRDRRAQEATTLQEQLKNNADAFNKYRARARAALESTAESLQDSEARHAVLQERLDAQDKARLLTEGESKESSSKMARELESLLMSKEELLSRWLDTQTVHSKQEQVVAEHVRELCSVRQQLEEARSEVDDAQKEVKARGQRARKIISEREAVIKQLEQALKANSATERSAPSSVMPITSRKAHGQVEQELLQIARGQGQRDKETGRLKLLNSNLEEEVLEKRLVVEQQENLIMELEKKIEEIYQDVARREELNAVEKTTYLKNVLKRFVVCGDKERDSLLPVVFQMLRFSPEEIAEVRKNSVKTTGFLNAF